MSIAVNDWKSYAREVIKVDDLDPMYGTINKARNLYGHQWACQYLMHFFMFYDAGQAAGLAKAETELDFWHMENYGYDHFKRGTERRHFRGEKGRQALLTFQRMGSPEYIWKKMHKPTYTQFLKNIEDNFQGTQTGPYFAWKAMDFLDRCLGMPISLSKQEAIKGMPDQPKKCAARVFPNVPLEDVLDIVLDGIKDLVAPGCETRTCGYSEVETILCTLQGHFFTNTYSIGDDIDKRHKQLKDYPQLKSLLPPVLDWSIYIKG